MKKKLIIIAAAAISAASGAPSGLAGTNPVGNLNYHIELAGSCTASVTSGTISLGSQFTYDGDILNAGAGQINVTCSNMSYAICVNGGNDPANPYRQLEHTTIPGNFLEYDLKHLGTVVGDNGCSAYAGGPAETAAWAAPINAVGTGALQPFALTADVLVPTDSIPGTYQDAAVAVTVVW